MVRRRMVLDGLKLDFEKCRFGEEEMFDFITRDLKSPLFC